MRALGRLGAMRARAESRMLDTFELRQYDDAWTYNAGAGEDGHSYTTLFTTPGRVKVEGGLSVRDAEVGGRTSASVVRTLHLPIGSDVIPPGTVAVCTAVHATSDPTLLGAALRIGGVAPGSQTTARRLEVEEVVS